MHVATIKIRIQEPNFCHDNCKNLAKMRQVRQGAVQVRQGAVQARQGAVGLCKKNNDTSVI
jgi:hypothetical protein